MKRVLNFWLVVAIVTLCVGLLSCNKDDEGGSSGNTTINGNVPEGAVVINGVAWATCNVGTPGMFAATSESSGMLYQWNSKMAWSVTEPAEGYDWDLYWEVKGRYDMPKWDVEGRHNNEDSFNEEQGLHMWTKTNDPSPNGFRIPTLRELNSLHDSEKVNQEWTTQNGVNGLKFTDRKTNASIFIPHVGIRDDYGRLYTNQTCLWGNTANEGLDRASFCLVIGESGTRHRSHHMEKGLSIHPVAESSNLEFSKQIKT